MSHSETKTIEIPFVKKNESDLPKIQLTYYNTKTKKNETFLVYDYIGHFEKFGLEWIQNDLGLKYVVKRDNSDKKKIKKQLTLSQQTRKKICLDESRVWNMENSWELTKSGTNGRISYLIGYLENENLMKSMLGIKGSSYDFTTLSAEVKTSYLYRLTKFVHFRKANTKSNDYFYSKHSLSFTVIMHVLNTPVLRFTDR